MTKYEMNKIIHTIHVNQVIIYKSNENINFIGVRKNKKYSNISRTRRKYKKGLKEYINNLISLNNLISSKMNYINRE